MIDSKTAKLFVGKFCQFVREENGRSIPFKGLLINVTDSDIIVKFNGQLQTYSLESLEHIREVGE